MAPNMTVGLDRVYSQISRMIPEPWPWDCVCERSADVQTFRVFTPDKIQNVEFYPPIVKMTFKNGTVISAKAQEGDEFNKETGMAMCILEYIFGDKKYNNMFRKWIKRAEKTEKEKEKALEEAKEKKEIKARQKAKRARQKARKAERRRQEAIAIQKEAYLQAMRERQADVDAATQG